MLLTTIDLAEIVPTPFDLRDDDFYTAFALLSIDGAAIELTIEPEVSAKEGIVQGPNLGLVIRRCTKDLHVPEMIHNCCCYSDLRSDSFGHSLIRPSGLPEQYAVKPDAQSSVQLQVDNFKMSD